MSQENSLTMLEKYFQPKRITQIIGDNLSIKESFIPIYLAHKTYNTSSKILFIYSKNTLNIRYIYEFHKILALKEGKNKYSLEDLEKKYLFIEFIKYESMGEFILKILPTFIEKEKTISTIVLNNLNNFLSTTSFKNLNGQRIYGNHLLNLARKYNLNIIYLNDYFYYCETKFLNNRNNINYIDPNNPLNKNINKEKDNDGGDINMKDYNNENSEDENNEIEDYYNKEPINYDILAEFCSHILFIESRTPRVYYGNFGGEDYIEQSIFRVIKSNYKPHMKYLVTINKKDFSYNIEIN